MLTEISQTEKDKHCMISLIREIFKKKKKNKLIDAEIRLTVEGEGDINGTNFQL